MLTLMMCASDGLPESSKDRQRCVRRRPGCLTQDKCFCFWLYFIIVMFMSSMRVII